MDRIDKSLSPFEENFATTAIAIDYMWGGNYEDPLAHTIVDGYTSGKEHPKVGFDDLRRLFIEKGVGVTDPYAVSTFVQHNAVQSRLGELYDYASGLKDPLRAQTLTHLLDVLKVQLELRLSMVGLSGRVSNESVYQTATGRPPESIDVSELNETLAHRLSQEGISVSGKGLYEAVDEWRTRNMLTADAMEEKFPSAMETLVDLTRKKILPHLPGWVAQIPIDMGTIDFGIERGDVFWSGYNVPLHTIINSNPVYKTELRLSHTVKMNEASFIWELVAHEGAPGHGLHLPILHTLYARGEYGFEHTLNIMCSPMSSLAEGIATSTSDLLHGTTLEGFTKDELIAATLSDINKFGRNNVVIEFMERVPDLSQLTGGEKDAVTNELIGILRKDYCFSEGDAEKYGKKWLFNERMGQLLGLMILPTYGVARKLVGQAISRHGRKNVIPVVYGTKGPVDITNFDNEIASATEQ